MGRSGIMPETHGRVQRGRDTRESLALNRCGLDHEKYWTPVRRFYLYVEICAEVVSRWIGS